MAPTDKTKAAYATIKTIADEVYDEALEGIPADRRGELVAMLRTIVTNLNDAEAEPCVPCIKANE